MNKDLYEKYVAIRFELKALEDKEKALKEQIVADLNQNKVEKITTDFGSFTICKKTSWKYSDKVKTIAERLKLAQIQEQEKGIATPVESQYLMFTEKKEE